MEQDFLPVLRFSPVGIIPPILNTHYHITRKMVTGGLYVSLDVTFFFRGSVFKIQTKAPLCHLFRL